MHWAEGWAGRVAWGSVALSAAAALGLTTVPARAAPSEPTLDRVLSDRRIDESSGLAVSRRHDGVLWTHNDSGDAARLYAIGPDGSTLATVTLAGLEPRDWEAMASSVEADGTPVLWVGDIGDNSGTRDNGILVHRIEEPAELVDAQVQPTSFRLRYPGSPVDAESLLVDPHDGRVIVISKAPLGGTVYAAPLALDSTDSNLLVSLGDAPDFLTDGAFVPDGRMLVRGYGAMWAGNPADGWSEPVTLPPSEQGESLTVSVDGSGVYVGSEGVRSGIWRLPLPAGRSPDATPAATSLGDTSAPDSTKAYGSGWVIPVLGGGVSLAVSVVLLLTRRRNRSR